MAKVTVLIADDLKFFLEVEKTFLQRAGFDVLTAASGERAVEQAKKSKPHLILLDLEMPKMDGVAACAAMRQDPTLASIPIIIMSATGSPENRERSLKAGCTEFVPKPEKPEDLLGLVARILEVKQREATRLTVVFNANGSLGSRQVVGQGRNLSTSGLLLDSPGPLAVGSILSLEFYLPKLRYQVKVQGEVTRSNVGPDGTHQAGIRFTDLSQADQEQILEYVSA
ncbi:MAG TPA: response regulator [Candidatus Polarisedimenticolia bacterium]|nr:response regulator [Candidatus Polarisedimenticolia bacterium]